MKKIALVTFHTPLSIGAQLQAFALQEAIEGNGYDCRILNFEPPSQKAPGRLPVTRRLFAEVSKVVFARKISRQRTRFADWGTLRLRRTDPITSESQLMREAEKYDAFVCGSDQIWRFPQRGYYYLDFTPEFAARIAYAPSFGNINFDESSRKLIAAHLNRFDFLTVRENDGAVFVSELVGGKVPSVIDPTLLWPPEYWRRFAADPGGPLPRKFVLVFSIQDTMACFRAAKKICSKLKMPPVIIDTARRLVWHPFLRNCFDAGPAEFLRLVDLADFVVTSSFHGTAFAVNFGKPFLTICRGETKNVNSRIYSLTDMLEVTDRLISPNEDVPKTVFADLAPEVAIRLNRQRERCCQILTKSLLLADSPRQRNNFGEKS